jgi:hypothetical protein
MLGAQRVSQGARLADPDLFRCDDERPFARIDRMSLILLLNSDRLLVLTAGAAVTRKGYASGEGRGAVGSPRLGNISPVAPPASPLRPRSCRDALRHE